MGWDGVQRVVDVSPIRGGIPASPLPNPALLTPELLMSALAIAVVARLR